MPSGVNDHQMVEVQVVEGDSHGSGGGRALGAFDFETHHPSLYFQPKIQLRPSVGSPVAGVGVGVTGQKLLDDHPLPACTQHGMALQFEQASNAEQSVQEP